jgi:cytidine deaminase
MAIPKAQRQALEAAAREAAKTSYAPYSRFAVGAAVLAADGRIYRGSNVENASYSLSCCAERVAIFQAVAAGNRTLLALALFTPTTAPVTPCGACLQVLTEFAEQAPILCSCSSDLRLETSLAELLPAAFGPAHLEPHHD